MNQQNNIPPAVLPRPPDGRAIFIPASDWISIGYSQAQARTMERLQTDMKKYCEDDNDDTKTVLRGSSGILPHHDMMLPHWQRLFESVNMEYLRIRSISLPIPVLDIIFSSLQSTCILTKMCLCDTNLGNEGLLRLASFLKEDSSLFSFALRETICDLSTASALSDALNNHPALRNVRLASCGLNNMAILEKILEGCKRMKHLSITGEEIRSETVGVLADFISGNHPTEVMFLNDNKITDSDSSLLASALENNTNLIQCDLSGNDITKVGQKKILKALYDPTSMDSIVESNHICRMYAYDIKNATVVAQRPHIEREVFNINKGDYTIGQKIRKKVVLALCGVDGELFDLSHLNDLPLQLMPRVLELIQKHTRSRTKVVKNRPIRLERDALSRLFHTLRGWELPLLFENLIPKKGAAGKRKREGRPDVV